MATQKELILNHLRHLGSISGMEASNLYKVRSLSSRISELKKTGLVIISERKHDITGQLYVRYRLAHKASKKVTKI